ncbi:MULTISPECIES: NAD(P)/FAD-dependent oxidoreductase [Pontibacillus]|uniref:FAD-binding oxidoreductase n=1 Tax=Pontibacillus chungwhensis TaxID=265426 RepID=A0ABY8UYU8_9BACI|nr:MULTISPECIES: FAD-binding oxidoreductase [Pontibacillus]MCD5324001.1 FAD-binding oxidoreductase [Pontibacillus sp. HN14]WIF97936.1 FAD-binding oxidoreductase [Pontibacillus chungwhensis]
MDLKSGSLLWVETFKGGKRYSRVTANLTCDVVVVGGGISGAIISRELVEAGLDTILVDKREIGQGSTSANTGLLQFSNDKSLTSCMATYGEQEGLRYYQMCLEGINKVQALAEECTVDPDFIKRDSLCFASSVQDLPFLQAEYKTLKKYGFRVDYLEQQDIERSFSFSKPGAIYAKGDAEINPFTFTIGLIDANEKKGLRVFENTEVVDHHEDEGEVTLLVKGDFTIRSKFVVYATGYEAQQMKRNKNAVLETSFAIATEPVSHFPGWKDRCLIWETARPYLYARTTADNRIVIGGLDETFIGKGQRERSLQSKRDQLLDSLRALFPGLEGIRADYYWGAVFGSTHDGFPIIGPQPEFPRSFFALNYGGNGTMYCTIAAELIRDFIVKGSHPDAPIFSFFRSPKKSNKTKDENA